jgi:hypothetical protein
MARHVTPTSLLRILLKPSQDQLTPLDVLGTLADKARSTAHRVADGALRIRGIWRCDYVLRLTNQESLFSLHYVLVQTEGQGCSYYDPADDQPEVSESLVGRSVLETQFFAWRQYLTKVLPDSPRGLCTRGSSIRSRHTRWLSSSRCQTHGHNSSA